MTFSEIQKDLEQGKEFTFSGADFISIKMIDGIVYRKYSDLDIAPFGSLTGDAYFSDHFIGWEEYTKDVDYDEILKTIDAGKSRITIEELSAEDFGEATKQLFDKDDMFAKYGFEVPKDVDYNEVVILGKDSKGTILGTVAGLAFCWRNGKAHRLRDDYKRVRAFDLTPIKKPWHKNQETQNTINDAVCSLRELLKQADSEAQEELNKMKSFLEALKESE